MHFSNTSDNPDKIKVVYATAGHEVRKWYKCTKKNGVLKIIDLVKAGREFSDAYESIRENSKCIENI